jgi:glycosidase
MKKIFVLIILSVLSFSCNFSKEKSLKVPGKSEIFGLASPVQLQIDSTIVHLQDYFDDVSKIDSINCDKNLYKHLSNDKKILLLKLKSDSLPLLSTLDVWVEGFKYSILLKKSEKIKYKFIFNPQGQKYDSVKLMGEINAWNPNNTPLKYDNGLWSATITALPGTYQYLLVINGKQQLDPNNKDSISNNMGGFNSIMKIGHKHDNKKPYLFTISHSSSYIRIGVESKHSKIFVFWNNFLLPENYVIKKDSSYQILVPAAAVNLQRSYIRVWTYNKYGFSNDLKIPLTIGYVIDTTSQLNRTDFENAVIYNVFVDRFYDADTTNDKPINNPSVVLPKVDFHGGDIEGVLQKMQQGYFDSLGVNTLWLSPIVKNVQGAYGSWPNPKTKFSAYHGYWPVSFTQIDKRFGTPEQFENLVSEAHTKNDNILIDYVAHHLHKDAPFYKEHPNWVTNLYLPDGSLNTQRWDDHRLTTWFDVFLPTLNNALPQVANIVSDSALWWVKQYGIDGFRHDAAKHVPLSFWRMLTYKLKHQIEIPQNRKLYQIGETYGTPQLIASYIGSGMLNAQFDFNVYDAIATALSINKSFKNVQKNLLTSFKYYGWHNLMGYITGNQDRGRFISYAGGALKYNEDAKMAGWTRNVEVGDTIAYKKSAMLFAFITTIPGVPVIYYGDEIGMPGANDPDNRRNMIFDNLNKYQKKLKNTASKLIKLRRHSMPLCFGDFKFIFVSDSLMVYQRTYFRKTVIVLFNNSKKIKKLKLKLDKSFNYLNLVALNKSKFYIKNDSLKINLSANSFEILFN